MVIRKTFPKIRTVQVKGSTFYQVDARKQGTDGKRETFSNRKQAEERAAQIAGEFAANGTEGLALSLELRSMAISCSKALAAFGKSIQDATNFYITHLQDELVKQDSARVHLLADAWYSDKASGKKRQLRKQTLLDIRDTSNLLKRLFPEKRLLEVQQQDIEHYFESLKVKERRLYNIRNLLNQFFNWCIKQNHTKFNPVAGIEIEVPTKDVAILSVEQCIKLMQVCEEKYPDLILYHALCLFAGLRPTECQLLEWEQVHLEERQITVLGTTSKTKETRNVHIEDNLLAWLESYQGQSKGLITRNANLVTRLKLLRSELGYNVLNKNPDGERWTEDILRHSYASYWIAKFKDRAHLAENMGNSIKMIKQHYKRIVANSAVTTFWSITPNYASKFTLVTEEQLKAARKKALQKALADS